MDLSKNDIQSLADEITARNDFEHAANGVRAELMCQPPSNTMEAVESWTHMLGENALFAASAAISVDERTKKLVLLAASPQTQPYWERLFVSSMGERVANHVRDRTALCQPLPDEFAPKDIKKQTLSICPCSVAEPPITLIAVSAPNAPTSLVQWMIEFSAARAGILLAMLERDRAEREMAARVAHMSAGSVLVAQLRLRAIVEREHLACDDVRQEIEAALTDLDDAQRGIDRARLLGIPGALRSERIPLCEFVVKLSRELNEAATNRLVIETSSLVRCAAEKEIFVKASPVRLHYALRDLILGPWILTDYQPITLSLSNGDTAQINLSTETPSDISAEQLWDTLNKPKDLVLSSERYLVERGIHLGVAGRLLQDLHGSIHRVACGSGHEFGIAVRLPLAKR